jgi:dipeptidyl aminopeptidase/acylaminoacyl peptidase
LSNPNPHRSGPAERTLNDGNLVLSGIPEIPAAIFDRLRPYQNARFATFADWNAEGSAMYVSTRFANVPQLHRVESPGGMRRQITFGEEPIREAVRRPGGRELLYAMDTGGGEFYQLFLLDSATGRSRLLTDGRSRNTSPLWSAAGDRIAYTSTRRDGRSNDVWILPADSPDQASLALRADDGSSWSAADWDPSDERLLIGQYVSVTESRVHVLDLASGEARRVDGSEAPSANYPVGFDREGTGIFLTTYRAGEFTRLAWLSLEAGELRPITGDIPWNVESAVLDRDRRRLAFTTNENGSSRLYLLDTATLAFRLVEGLPLGVVFGLRFSPDGRHLGFTFDSGTSPADAHSLELGEEPLEQGGIVRWTFSEVGGLDPARFIAPEPISFRSFDELEVPAFLYQPPGEGPHPVVIHIHGGPEGQSRPLFTATFQAWVAELGAAVIDPNVRGSSGYGKSYLTLDNGMLREDSVRDIGALLDWIAANPRLDAERVIVYGGSYGGYMVLASLIHFGDRLRGGVDIVGISDFITFLENTQDYRRDLRRVEYGDERDPEMRAFFERISPLRNADRIRAPLFVIQGRNDPRVPVTEAEQIVERVRASGRPVWYMNALNEGHGYARKENQDVMRAAVMKFLGEFLGVEGGGAEGESGRE